MTAKRIHNSIALLLIFGMTFSMPVNNVYAETINQSEVISYFSSHIMNANNDEIYIKDKPNGNVIQTRYKDAILEIDETTKDEGWYKLKDGGYVEANDVIIGEDMQKYCINKGILSVYVSKTAIDEAYTEVDSENPFINISMKTIVSNTLSGDEAYKVKNVTNDSIIDVNGTDVHVKTSGLTAVVKNIEIAKGERIVNYARQFTGNPYVWGGSSLTNGVDCSHFVWLVLRNSIGYDTGYHTSNIWANYGTPVRRLSEAQAGDVIVYDGHVAIYDGHGKIVEAANQIDGIISHRSANCSPIIAIRRFV